MTPARATQRAVWTAIIAVVVLTLLLGGLLAFFIRRQLVALSRAFGQTLATTEEQAAALRESNKRTTNILESIGDAFVALDTNWRFTYANPRAEQILQRPRGELINQNIWEVFPEMSGTVFSEKFRRASTDKAAIKFEGTHPTLNRTFATSAYPSPEGLSVYLDDITDRHAAEQEQARLREEQARLRDEIIRMQAARLEELSTPLIPLSREVVLMPLIGTLDRDRAAQVLEVLSHGVAARGALVAVLDITGVSHVDTHVAAALVQAAQVVRLLGAEVVLTGIRAGVSQSLVGLGVDLGGIATRRTLQSGIDHARELLLRQSPAFTSVHHVNERRQS
ncbi:MAG: PAS domain-containing protein [Acidobacteriota bacterium]|nr:PAS domain-containing protein [Acidobacteriota bacterium]